MNEEQRLSAAELWFLDAAFEFWIDLPVLVSRDVALALNRRTHGLDSEQVVTTLAALYSRGFIDGRWHQEPYALTPECIRQGLGSVAERGSAPYYGLTVAGGEAWEAATMPRWVEYVTHDAGFEGDIRNSTIEAATRERARAELEQSPDRALVIDESIEEELLVPWRPTYWKVLPEGFRIQYRARLEASKIWRRRH
jgi:hypothetical protein